MRLSTTENPDGLSEANAAAVATASSEIELSSSILMSLCNVYLMKGVESNSNQIEFAL